MCLLVMAVLVKHSVAQKGGAKGAMRNRGKGGGGGRRGGGGHHAADEDDVADILDNYDYSKPRPCVGLCFIR